MIMYLGHFQGRLWPNFQIFFHVSESSSFFLTTTLINTGNCSFYQWTTIEFMNEGSPTSYQRSKSVTVGTKNWTAECEELERRAAGVGYCQNGFTGFKTASSTLSTNCYHGGIWLLPLVVGSWLIISPTDSISMSELSSHMSHSWEFHPCFWRWTSKAWIVICSCLPWAAWANAVF